MFKATALEPAGTGSGTKSYCAQADEEQPPGATLLANECLDNGSRVAFEALRLRRPCGQRPSRFIESTEPVGQHVLAA